MVRSQGGRDGAERVRSLRGKREESREKREERQTSTTLISRGQGGEEKRTRIEMHIQRPNHKQIKIRKHLIAKHNIGVRDGCRNPRCS